MSGYFRCLLKVVFGISVFFAFSANAQFDRNLTIGARGEDVKALQQFLIDENVYPEKLVTGYFGPLTRAAVIRFQEKYVEDILIPWGLTPGTGTGFFGPMSRKKANLNYGDSTSLLKIGEPTSNSPTTSTMSDPSHNPAVFVTYKSYDGFNDYSEFEGGDIILGENFEISFKLKFSGGKLATIIQRGSDSVDDKYWYVQTTGDGSGRLEFQISDGIGFALVQTAIPANSGAWHEIIWTRAGDKHIVKIDGVDQTKSGNIDPGIDDINPSKSIYIGGDPQSNENFFKGDIGEVKIILK